ncbi:uncharacterized protein BJ212DRAFT_1481852 [Suillus subaureus]|uniref:HNH nuclease domain-containing protein n=1 Tax=Suillus subaureus TaxID=48587 RepID=A0A9P7E8W6_9AGAM|nr:uncharacterized protein BJ212DRAFT_1481852 [Suillus subaureus]KAG1814646.1 hypothetical protein BJ212DRAFT_1481852 [Suillus subaureus]
MSLDDDTSSASTLTLLDDDAFKTGLLTVMSDAGPETNGQLKRRAKAVLRETESMLTSVHGVKTFGILDGMMEGAGEAGLSSGVRYAAAAIIVADQKGRGSNLNSPASELTRLAQDWLLFFIWPFKKAYRAGHSPQSEFSTPTLHVSDVAADAMPATSRRSIFRNLINERDGDKCVVTGTLNIANGPYPRTTEVGEGYLDAAHILPRSIVHEHPRSNRIAGTIDIIKHYTKLPDEIMDDLAGIIDNPENGMLLDIALHRGFDSYRWCLHPTDVLHKYKVHWLRYVPLHKENFTEVQFRDHSRDGVPLPNPTLIALHSAVAHVLHISGAAEVIDKVYDAFSDEGPTVPSGNRASEDDFRIRLSLIGLTTNKHQLPTIPDEMHAFQSSASNRLISCHCH